MRFILLGAAVFCCVPMSAQQRGVMQTMKSPGGTVCYAATTDAGTLVPPPKQFLLNKARGAKTQTANIQVTYNGFSTEARNAFEAAVEIWESLLTSSVTIRIHANWSPLGQSILGGAGPGTYITNFEGAPRKGVWYPVALAEKIAGKELNGSEPDIVATFNSNNDSWHFGLSDDNPPSGKYDLMTVVMHEIGHGLGITHSYDVEGENGVIADYFNDLPVVYETNVENNQGQNIVVGFDQPSVDLKTQLTSNNLFYNTPLVVAANGGQQVRIYAPSQYSGGSSIAHLNESSFPAGNPNSMMTPSFQPQERILNPGPIALAILNDIGWTRTRIDHTKLQNSEDPTGPFGVKAKIVSDNGYSQSSVKLRYTPANGSSVETVMTPTAIANEFSANIPGGINSYRYFISVTDNSSRLFTTPGIFYQQGEPPAQEEFQFAAGPDTKAPIINHDPVKFITKGESLKIDAVVFDKFGVAEVKMDWQINNIDQPVATLQLVDGTDSTYAVTINMPGSLDPGDIIKYRLRSKDVSLAANTSAIPSAAGYFTINVVGLGSPRAFYANNFNNPNSEDDFFGNGFGIVIASGFVDSAIHTVHPYPEGFDAPNQQRNFIYNLKFPIIVNALHSTIRFDEIVLVEPGDNGSVFGEPDFFDYVVVEGSPDGGVTWIPVGNGYDSRDKQVWLSAYNSGLVENISTTPGTPAMYQPRQLDLLTRFHAGDEVALRFRLFSDPHAAGWGWAIDNLRIQIDETPPAIVHQHFDHVMAGSQHLDLAAHITDAAGLHSVVIEYNKTGQPVVEAPLIINPVSDSYSFQLPLTSLALQVGSELQYRIRATDVNGNESTSPSSGFYKVAVLGMSPSSDLFTHNFNSSTTDVGGNFFSIEQPGGFNNGAWHSIHPYTAISTTNTEFSFLVKKPIRISASNSFLSFDEILVAEYSFTTVKDYAIVEGSLDGKTWEKITDAYSSNVFGGWRGLFDTNGIPAATSFAHHLIDLTESGKFKAGDVILIRFRLFSDLATTGWGWAIDNLSIQGPATGLESEFAPAVSPNPARDKVRLNVYLAHAMEVGVSFISPQGQLYRREIFNAPAGQLDKELSISDLPRGLFLMKVDTGEASFVKKMIRE